MGAKRKSSAEPRGASIRLHFWFNGAKVRGSLPIPATASNMKVARRTLAEIEQEILAGTFVWAQHFPDSVAPEALGGASALSSATLFQTYVEKWRKGLSDDIDRGYQSHLNVTWLPGLGAKRLRDIRFSDIREIVATQSKTVTGKTIKNHLATLRLILDAAIEDDLIDDNPARRVKAPKHQTEACDPFEPVEVVRILADLKANDDIRVWAYYQFALATGVRPSEQIALSWPNISEARRKATIRVARTRAREKGTKTHTVREIDLQPAAIEALTAMKAFTRLAGGKVFQNPATGRPWASDERQRINHFHPCLERLGIRKRDAYQCRHTFATLGLMNGSTPSYVSEQLGHSDTKLVHSTYGKKWIKGVHDERERARMEAAWPSLSLPVVPSNNPDIIPAMETTVEIA